MRYNRKSINITVPPEQRAVTLDEVKQYLRVDGTQDDEMLGTYILAATEYLEQYCGRKFITQTAEFHLDGFGRFNDEKLIALGEGVHDGYKGDYLSGGADYIDLPFKPVQSVVSLITYDDANNSATFTSSAYRLDSNTGRVYLNTGYTWPTDLRDYDAIKITFICGYGDSPNDMPAPIRQAVKMQVAKMYECAGACDMSDACKALLASFRTLDGLAW